MSRIKFGNLDGIHSRRKQNPIGNVLASVGLFTMLLVAFLLVVARINSSSIEKEKELLSDAIDRGVIQCYISEGRYPESFAYLQENYGILYDSDKFRVDYSVFGSNMKPQIVIVTLED